MVNSLALVFRVADRLVMKLHTKAIGYAIRYNTALPEFVSGFILHGLIDHPVHVLSENIRIDSRAVAVSGAVCGLRC